MPRTKKVKSVKTSTVYAKRAKAKKDSFLSQIKWGESYTSLFLGAVVVVVAIVLVFSFVKSRNALNKGETGSTSIVSKQAVGQLPQTYTVKPGDYLWSIAEKIYGSGYNWTDIANANHLTNPGVIYAGTKLVIPNVAPKTVTVQPAVKVANPIMGSTYTVVKGDYLWSIAIRAYGDGYRWVDIAKANNLVNPDLIFPGNVLRLPR
jgi:nucleoid-associated protein YgaU